MKILPCLFLIVKSAEATSNEAYTDRLVNLILIDFESDRMFTKEQPSLKPLQPPCDELMDKVAISLEAYDGGVRQAIKLLDRYETTCGSAQVAEIVGSLRQAIINRLKKLGTDPNDQFKRRSFVLISEPVARWTMRILNGMGIFEDDRDDKRVFDLGNIDAFVESLIKVHGHIPGTRNIEPPVSPSPLERGDNSGFPVATAILQTSANSSTKLGSPVTRNHGKRVRNADTELDPAITESRPTKILAGSFHGIAAPADWATGAFSAVPVTETFKVQGHGNPFRGPFTFIPLEQSQGHHNSQSIPESKQHGAPQSTVAPVSVSVSRPLAVGDLKGIKISGKHPDAAAPLSSGVKQALAAQAASRRATNKVNALVTGRLPQAPSAALTRPLYQQGSATDRAASASQRRAIAPPMSPSAPVSFGDTVLSNQASSRPKRATWNSKSALPASSSSRRGFPVVHT